MFAYKSFEISPEFADELNVVLKCQHCGHIFSPGVDAETIKRGMQVGEAIASAA